MPQIRPFRALRYDREASGTRRRSSRRRTTCSRRPTGAACWPAHDRNVVRLDAPADELGDAEDDRYRRAARTLAAWRSDGTLHKDPRPAIYVYEQTYARAGHRRSSGPSAASSPGSASSRSSRDPASCRTSGRSPPPREDRYRLLRATGVNTSPVVGLYDDPIGRAASAILATLAAGTPDDRRRRRRRRRAPAVGRRGGRAARRAAVAELIAIASARAGHDRRRPPSLRDGPALPRRAPDEPVVRGGPGVRLPPDAVPRDHRRAADRPADAPDRARPRRRRRRGAVGRPGRAVRRPPRPTGTSCCDAFGGEPRAGAAARAGSGSGRATGGAILSARRAGVRAGSCPTAVRPSRPRRRPARGGAGAARRDRPRGGRRRRPARLHEVRRGGARGGRRRPRTAPTPRSSSSRPRSSRSPRSPREGDVMPQKSTYFYPKALTGLVINPHEW